MDLQVIGKTLAEIKAALIAVHGKMIAFDQELAKFKEDLHKKGQEHLKKPIQELLFNCEGLSTETDTEIKDAISAMVHSCDKYVPGSSQEKDSDVEAENKASVDAKDRREPKEAAKKMLKNGKEKLEELIQRLTSLRNLLRKSQEDVHYRIQDLLNYKTLADETEVKKGLMDLFKRNDEYKNETEELLVPIGVMKEQQEEIENQIAKLIEDGYSQKEDPIGGDPQSHVTEAGTEASPEAETNSKRQRV